MNNYFVNAPSASHRTDPPIQGREYQEKKVTTNIQSEASTHPLSAQSEASSIRSQAQKCSFTSISRENRCYHETKVGTSDSVNSVSASEGLAANKPKKKSLNNILGTGYFGAAGSSMISQDVMVGECCEPHTQFSVRQNAQLHSPHTQQLLPNQRPLLHQLALTQLQSHCYDSLEQEAMMRQQIIPFGHTNTSLPRSSSFNEIHHGNQRMYQSNSQPIVNFNFARISNHNHDMVMVEDSDDDCSMDDCEIPSLPCDSDSQKKASLSICDAILENNTRGLQFLLEKFPRATRTVIDGNQKGNLPIHVAAEIGHFESLQTLFSFDRSAALIRNFEGSTVLNIAIDQGNAKMVQFICEIIPTVAKMKRDGNLPLHCALIGLSEHENIVYHIANVLLHSYPEAANVPTEEGLSPLQLASISGIPMLIYSLLHRCFESSSQREVMEGLSALDFAVDGYVLCKRLQTIAAGMNYLENSNLVPQQQDAVHYNSDQLSYRLENVPRFKGCIDTLLMSILYGKALPAHSRFNDDAFYPLHAAVSALPLEQTWKNLLEIFVPHYGRQKESNLMQAPLHHLCCNVLNPTDNDKPTILRIIKDLHSIDPEATRAPDNNGLYPLHYAVINGAEYDIVAEILSCAHDVNELPVRDKCSVLLYRDMHPFQIAALSSTSSLDTVYMLLRNSPSLINCNIFAASNHAAFLFSSSSSSGFDDNRPPRKKKMTTKKFFRRGIFG